MGGVFGTYSFDGQNVLNTTYVGLRILQTRGQESGGITVAGENSIRTYREEGYVANIFDEKILKIFDNPSDYSSIGQVRKFKVTNKENIEPIELKDGNFKISVVMDGKLFDQDKFSEYDVDPRESTELFGKIFLKHLVETGKTNKAAEKTMKDLDKGYFSTAILLNDGKRTREIGIRDKRGLKPYCIGRLGRTYLLSSESVAFNTLNAELLRDVKPGEFIEFDPEDPEPKFEQLLKPEPKHCAFEYVYYASRASVIEGRSVDRFRKEMGRKIYEFYKKDGIKKGKVVPSPNSGRGVGLGFAQASGWVYDESIMRNVFSIRTFISPNELFRESETDIKFIMIKDSITDQIIIITEDSIMRSTVSRQNTKACRRVGAKEVHYVVSSPPSIATCPDYIYEGHKTFIASKYNKEKNVKEIGKCVAKEIGADSVMYPTINMLVEAIGKPRKELCLGCFTGEYPFKI